MTTHALILETNNLASAEDADALEAALARLLRHLHTQTLSPGELLVTHDGLSQEAQRRLERAHPVTWVALPPETNYYDAKRLGFDACDAEIVVFGDTDCWPVPGWYASLVDRLTNATDAEVAAGRTTYPETLLGAAVSTIDFMYFAPDAQDAYTLNFYANNVAFRRDVFARHFYEPAPGVYRGHCQRLGMRLRKHDVKIAFVPQARTYHELPASVSDFIALRLHRGSDAALLSQEFVGAYAPGPLRGLGRTRPKATTALMLTRTLLSLGSFGRQEMPDFQGVMGVAARAAMLGTTALDAAGAVLGVLGRTPSSHDPITTEHQHAHRDAA